MIYQRTAQMIALKFGTHSYHDVGVTWKYFQNSTPKGGFKVCIENQDNVAFTFRNFAKFMF